MTAGAASNQAVVINRFRPIMSCHFTFPAKFVPPTEMETSSRPTKRLASTLDERGALSKKLAPCRNNTTTLLDPLALVPSVTEIRAFGLEDRAEAVISRDEESWTLANLSKWRRDIVEKVAKNSGNQQSTQLNSKLSSKEYLRQRQRAYRHQCLASFGKPK